MLATARPSACITSESYDVGYTMIAIIFTQVQMTLLLGDITSALASADADRVDFETKLDSFKVGYQPLQVTSVVGSYITADTDWK